MLRCGADAVSSIASMSPNDLAQLLTAAFERAAERLRAAGHEDPWPEDLWARDVVRLLRERAPEVARRAENNIEEPD
jgi:hypothetical protein